MYHPHISHLSRNTNINISIYSSNIHTTTITRIITFQSFLPAHISPPPVFLLPSSPPILHSVTFGVTLSSPPKHPSTYSRLNFSKHSPCLFGWTSFLFLPPFLHPCLLPSSTPSSLPFLAACFYVSTFIPVVKSVRLVGVASPSRSSFTCWL